MSRTVGSPTSRSIGSTAATSESRPSGVRTSTRGVVVDEELHDRLGRPDGLAPEVGCLADDLVGVLALGQPDDADVGEARRRSSSRCDLADQRDQLGGAEVPALWPAAIDVVGEHDPRA